MRSLFLSFKHFLVLLALRYSAVHPIIKPQKAETITITNILDDNVYTELVRKNSIDVKAGTLEITYSRTDERVNHNEWAEGGTLTVTRK